MKDELSIDFYYIFFIKFEINLHKNEIGKKNLHDNEIREIRYFYVRCLKREIGQEIKHPV